MDIRAFVVRAVVYIFMLTVLGVAYASLVINTGFTFLQNNGLEEYEEFFYVAATLLVASSFRPLRLMVDRLTNKIFFQDSYDTKSVLDKISTLLVRGTSPDALAKQSMMILQQALKVKHIGIVIKELDQEDVWRAIGVGSEICATSPGLRKDRSSRSSRLKKSTMRIRNSRRRSTTQILRISFDSKRQKKLSDTCSLATK
jgi:hypothetical protein